MIEPVDPSRGPNLRFGRRSTPPGPIRATDHRLRSPLGGFTSDTERDHAFRSFQFMGAVADSMAVGCAVTSTVAGLSAFAYVWTDDTFTQLRMAGHGDDHQEFATDPDAGTTRLETSRGTLEMSADGSHKRLLVDSPTLHVDLAFDDSAMDVLRLCTPTGPTGWAYVQKVAATPATGNASSEPSTVDFGSLDALAHHDYTTGFLRPETWWHWACISARLSDGRRLGLNLSCGTNESGYRENGAWLDDHWFDLGGALFEFDPDDTVAPWRIVSAHDRFSLSFASGHGYHALHESPALSTNFHQLFGHFDGWLVTDEGERVEFAGLGGFAESQYLRW